MTSLNAGRTPKRSRTWRCTTDSPVWPTARCSPSTSHSPSSSATRNHESRAILVIDLDRFKWINDSFGHDQGDRLLKQFADRLVAATRESDTVARLGGDEFAILPGDAADLPAAAGVVWKLQHLFAAGFELDQQVVQVSASIGIATFPEHGNTPAELLRRADVAMYEAKRSGSGHAVADNAQEELATRQLELLLELRKCVSATSSFSTISPRSSSAPA